MARETAAESYVLKVPANSTTIRLVVKQITRHSLAVFPVYHSHWRVLPTLMVIIPPNNEKRFDNIVSPHDFAASETQVVSSTGRLCRAQSRALSDLLATAIRIDSPQHGEAPAETGEFRKVPCAQTT